jgi:hypothetical protein
MSMQSTGLSPEERTGVTQNFLVSLPPYVPLKRFCEVFGHSRSRVYQFLGEEKLRGRKDGAKLLIEVASELERLESLPNAVIKAPEARPDRPAEPTHRTGSPALAPSPPPQKRRAAADPRRGRPRKRTATTAPTP